MYLTKQSSFKRRISTWILEASKAVSRACRQCGVRGPCIEVPCLSISSSVSSASFGIAGPELSKQMPAPLDAGNSWEEQFSHHTNHSTERKSAFGSDCVGARETSPLPALQLLLCYQRTIKFSSAREVALLETVILYEASKKQQPCSWMLALQGLGVNT